LLIATPETKNKGVTDTIDYLDVAPTISSFLEGKIVLQIFDCSEKEVVLWDFEKQIMYWFIFIFVRRKLASFQQGNNLSLAEECI